MLAFGVPSEFSRRDIEAVAALAYLELDSAEAELFARQLGDILAYAELVQQVDTSGVPPTAHVATSAVERPDVPGACLPVGDALANAPDPARDQGLFRVPRVIG
jgi:aspartyl-tRNA(Asn)/glutamyl-tRNA(Gln) amidotransferase subunit C